MNKKWIIWIAAIVAITALLCVFPIFRVESLSEKKLQVEAASFNPQQLVKKVWNGDLKEATQKSTDLLSFLEVFKGDTQKAIEQFGNKVGVSSKCHFMMQLRGVVVSSEQNKLTIQPMGEEGTLIEVINGPVFGNSVRDGSGLFKVGDFTDTRKFNDVSAELNQKIEKEVLPLLFQQANPGKELSMTGCFTLSTKNPSIEIIRFIPIEFEMR